MNEVKTGN